MSRHLLLAAAALGLAFGLAGCDVSSGAEPGAEGNSAIVLHSATPGEPLLARMQSAPTAVAYRGTRSVEQSWQVGQQVYSTRYREEVASDGAGRFALRTLELLDPNLAPSQRDLWLLLQESREGFLFRYRDFRLHDPAQLAANYTTLLLGTQVTVAGRNCLEVVVSLRYGRPFTYNLAVDRETGLVLRCEQVAADGRRMGLVEFESLELAPVFPPDFEWHVAGNDERPLPLGERSRRELGFEAIQPDAAGPRFRILESTLVESPDPQGQASVAWAKTTLTDGVEVVFVLHGGPDSSGAAGDVVRVSPSVGPWNHVEGVLSGQRVMALGRVSVDDLLDVVDATF